MSKLLLPILIICLALWLLLGSFWLGINTEGKPAETTKSHAFVIENEAFRAEAPTIFAFSPSEVNVIINDEQLTVLDSLALYLNSTPQKQLLMSAYYEDTEKYIGTYTNIGIARAETIKNILIRKGAPEAQVKVQGKLVDVLDLNENGLISGGIEFDIFDREHIITPGNKMKGQQITFLFEADEVRVKKYPALENEVAELKQLLTDFPESKLRITGFFNQYSIKRQQAQKRADEVYHLLIQKGISPERINPVSIELEQVTQDPEKSSPETVLGKVEVFVF